MSAFLRHICSLSQNHHSCRVAGNHVNLQKLSRGRSISAVWYITPATSVHHYVKDPSHPTSALAQLPWPVRIVSI